MRTVPFAVALVDGRQPSRPARTPMRVRLTVGPLALTQVIAVRIRDPQLR